MEIMEKLKHKIARQDAFWKMEKMFTDTNFFLQILEITKRSHDRDQ